MKRTLTGAMLLWTTVAGGTALADKKGKEPAKAAAPAKEAAKKEDPMAAQMQAMMAAMEKAGTPGAEHKKLADWTVGTWTATVKMFMGPKTMESTGTAEYKPIFGGRYIVEEFNGTFMGKPFMGHGMSGYDNAAKKFVGSWIDSSSTSIMSSEGTLDEKTNTITYTTTATDPMSGKPMSAKMVAHYESDKKHTAEMFEKGPDGKEMKSMEITYTKK